jgi:iron complex outermembrane receptor protein
VSIRWTSLILTFPSLATSLAAQTGTLRGTVTHEETKLPLVAACIAVDQSACTATTDARGTYLIRGLPTGAHQVVFTAIGSKPLRRSVTISAGQTETLDAALELGPLILSSLVVTATRLPTDAQKVASTVDVLTPEQIRTSPARETQDLLREIPAVELARTSSLVGGTAQIVSIRGVDEGRTVVLFDGIPISDAWGEWIDWGRVPKGMLDRVEVVEGGSSNLYGNGAIGGVISFFSRPLAPGSAMVTVDGGSRDAKHGFASVALPLARGLTAVLSGDYLDGGGYTLLDPAKRGAIDVPSEITQKNGSVRLTYAPTAKFSAFVTGHAFGDDRHLGTPLGLQTRDQWNTDVGLNFTGAADRFAFRSWYGHQDEFQRSTAVRGNAATCPSAASSTRACEDSSVVATIPSTDWGASLVWTRDRLFGLETFSLGADYRHMSGEFAERDFGTTCPGVDCGTLVRTINSGGDQGLGGVFAQAIAAPAPRWRIELGARIDWWNNTDGRSVDPIAGTVTYPDRSKTAFSPRLGVRYAVTPRLSLRSAAYQAFRAPNLAELYRKQINANASTITIPNPDLKAETGRGYELGFDWQPAQWVQLRGTAYQADYRDFNVPTQISAGPPAVRQRINIAKSRSRGGSAYLAVEPVAGWLVSAGGSWDRARIVSSDSTNGQRVNRVPSPRYTIRTTYTSRVLGSWTALWRHEGETTTLQGATLAPFSVFDANAQREIVPDLVGFVSVENIGNKQYQINLSGTGANTLISYGLPRTVRVGLTWTR